MCGWASPAVRTQPRLAWLTGLTFKFHDENGVQHTQQSKDVTDQQQLDYVYEDMSVPGPDQEAAARGTRGARLSRRNWSVRPKNPSRSPETP